VILISPSGETGKYRLCGNLGGAPVLRSITARLRKRPRQSARLRLGELWEAEWGRGQKWMTCRVVRRSWCPREVDRYRRKPARPMALCCRANCEVAPNGHSVGVGVTGMVARPNPASGDRPKIKARRGFLRPGASAILLQTIRFSVRSQNAFSGRCDFRPSFKQGENPPHRVSAVMGD
jgi:hypothetical protein